MAGILEQIKGANDIKAVSPSKYDELAQELREFIIHSVSETGGHLASNLGVVELTMALHLCLDLPKDKIIWDVGHQSYTHKILTGRKDEFAGLRSFGGMSGFPKHRESQCDAFDTGIVPHPYQRRLAMSGQERSKARITRSLPSSVMVQ